MQKSTVLAVAAAAALLAPMALSSCFLHCDSCARKRAARAAALVPTEAPATSEPVAAPAAW